MGSHQISEFNFVFFDTETMHSTETLTLVIVPKKIPVVASETLT